MKNLIVAISCCLFFLFSGIIGATNNKLLSAYSDTADSIWLIIEVAGTYDTTIYTDATGYDVVIDLDTMASAMINIQDVRLYSGETNKVSGTESVDNRSVNVASVDADAIEVGDIQTDAINADVLAGGASSEIADAIWDEAMSGHTSLGTFGDYVGDLYNGDDEVGIDAISGSATAADRLEAFLTGSGTQPNLYAKTINLTPDANDTGLVIKHGGDNTYGAFVEGLKIYNEGPWAVTIEGGRDDNGDGLLTAESNDFQGGGVRIIGKLDSPPVKVVGESSAKGTIEGHLDGTVTSLTQLDGSADAMDELVEAFDDDGNDASSFEAPIEVTSVDSVRIVASMKQAGWESGAQYIWVYDTASAVGGMGLMLKDVEAYQGEAAGLDSATVYAAVVDAGTDYPAIFGGEAGTGANSVTIYAVDTSGVDNSVSGVQLGLENLAQEDYAAGRTSAQGYKVFNAATNDTLLVTGYAAGYIWATDDTIIVTGDIVDTVKGYDIEIEPPSSADLCVVWGDVRDIQGNLIEGASVTVTLLGSNMIDTCSGTFPIVGYVATGTTNSSGRFTIDVVKSKCLVGSNNKYMVEATYPNMRRSFKAIITVPDSESYQVDWQ